MKNLAIFCDGTWQYLDQPHPTNVAKLARTVLPQTAQGTPQFVYYDDGVGVSQGALSSAVHLVGGVFGKGLDYKIARAYEFLCLNYEPGDRIFIFGFSRGAYTARSLAGLLRWAWILKRDNASEIYTAMALYRSHPPGGASQADEDAFQARAQAFRDQYCFPHAPFTAQRQYEPDNPASLTPGDDCAWVQHVGVWDTVGSLGIPSNFVLAPEIDAQYRFHDMELSRFVRSARHAVSIDERRTTFTPALWSNIAALNTNALADGFAYDRRPYQQKWFPGGHGCVGGGGDDGGISLAPMLWVAEGAARAGMAFDQGELDHYASLAHPEAKFAQGSFNLGEFIIEAVGAKDRVGPATLDEVGLSTHIRWNAVQSYRPKPLEAVSAALGALPAPPAPAPYFAP
jgi:uncharacterized protein (DUF2235 family)